MKYINGGIKKFWVECVVPGSSPDSIVLGLGSLATVLSLGWTSASGQYCDVVEFDAP